MTYYEEKFHSEVLGAIEIEDQEIDLDAGEILILGEYPKEYVKKYLTSTGRMKRKVKIEKIKKRKTVDPESFLKGFLATEKETKFESKIGYSSKIVRIQERIGLLYLEKMG